MKLNRMCPSVILVQNAFREKSLIQRKEREREIKSRSHIPVYWKKTLLSLLNKSFLKAPSDIHCDRENSHQQQLAAKEYWAALSSSQEMGILGSKSFYTGWKCPFFFTCDHQILSK